MQSKTYGSLCASLNFNAKKYLISINPCTFLFDTCMYICTYIFYFLLLKAYKGQVHGHSFWVSSWKYWHSLSVKFSCHLKSNRGVVLVESLTLFIRWIVSQRYLNLNSNECVFFSHDMFVKFDGKSIQLLENLSQMHYRWWFRF